MDEVKILIIDDDDDIRGLVKALLSSHADFVVEEAASGGIALEKINSWHPDILFIDQHLEDISGLTLLDKAKKLSPDNIAIMLTADNSQALAVQAFRHGASDFVSKPFDHEYLMLVAQRALKQLMDQRELSNTKVLFAAAEEQRQEAEESWRRERDFLSNMSHELRTPAQIIHTTLSLIKDELRQIQSSLYEARTMIEKDESKYPERIYDIISTITSPLDNEDDFNGEKLSRIEADVDEAQKAAKRLRNTTTRVLDLAKLSSGQVEFLFSEHDLSEMAISVAKNFRTTADEKNITLAINTYHPIHAEIDQTFMEQVLTNIVSNALKFTPSGGKVTLTVSEIGGIISISVADTGHGVPLGEERLIFKRFHQASNKEHSNQSIGTGLGLALCQEVILKHNGIIYATHNHPQGLIINIEIPRHQRHSQSAA